MKLCIYAIKIIYHVVFVCEKYLARVGLILGRKESEIFWGVLGFSSFLLFFFFWNFRIWARRA